MGSIVKAKFLETLAPPGRKTVSFSRVLHSEESEIVDAVLQGAQLVVYDRLMRRFGLGDVRREQYGRSVKIPNEFLKGRKKNDVRIEVENVIAIGKRQQFA